MGLLETPEHRLLVKYKRKGHTLYPLGKGIVIFISRCRYHALETERKYCWGRRPTGNGRWKVSGGCHKKRTQTIRHNGHTCVGRRESFLFTPQKGNHHYSCGGHDPGKAVNSMVKKNGIFTCRERGGKAGLVGTKKRFRTIEKRTGGGGSFPSSN